MSDQRVSFVQEDLHAAAAKIHAALMAAGRGEEPRVIDDERLRVTTDHLFWVKCGHRVERHDLPDGMREQVKAADEIIPFRHDAKPLLVDIERELAARVYWRERLAD